MIMEKEETNKIWDESAVDHQKVFSMGQSEYTEMLLKFWEDKGMLRPGIRCLDVGCGIGKYGVYFAQRGCDVTLMDISPKMLGYAEENLKPFKTPYQIYLGDFNTVTGNEDVFKEGFDLSISTMSPAIHDVDTVKKFSNMTHGTCFLARFYTWDQPFRDRLAKEMGLDDTITKTGILDDVNDVLKAIKDAGYDPKVKLVDYNWSDDRTPEEMADYLYRHIWINYDNGEELKAKCIDACKNLSEKDGTVTDAVYTKVAWIYWSC